MSDLTPFIELEVVLDNGNLPSDMIVWLEENIGEMTEASIHDKQWYGEGWAAWRVCFGWTKPIRFKIKDVKKAILFKLVWGGL